jgi:hypothetical protein
MKLYFSKTIILFPLIATLLQCASFYQSKQLVYSTRNSAFYRIPKDEVKNKELIKEKFTHPYSFQSEKLIDILGNLRFKKYTRIGSLQDFVFHLNELSTLTVDLKQVFENSKQDDCIMVISMFDHTQSVISNNKRTTFLTWVDSKGLNLVLGEIQSDVPRDTSANFFEWTLVPQIPLSILPDENEIEQDKDQPFVFNIVKGYTNKKWLIFPLTDLNKYQLKDRKFNSGKKTDNQ